MTLEQLIASHTKLLAENERLRRELAKFTDRPGRHANKASPTETLARKAFAASLEAAGVLLIVNANVKAPEDVRRGFWYAASRAGISINVSSRVSHTHHSTVRKFLSKPTDTSTIAYRKARDAARAVFTEEARKQ